jgi:hypothetical protein
LGGKDVLESFDNEAEAREFWQEQLDTADYSECDFDDEDGEDE